MTSVPVSSMTSVELLACWTFPGSGKKQELFENGRERIMWSTSGARDGTVKETATRRQIGSEILLLEFGTNSNHFSTESLETGARNSWRESEVEPNIFGALFIGKLEVEWDMSSKSSSPVGSHWKEATCFSPDSDKILSLRLALKNASGCLLQNETKRLPLCSSGKFLTSTNSKRAWKRNLEEKKWELSTIMAQAAYPHLIHEYLLYRTRSYKQFITHTKS